VGFVAVRCFGEGKTFRGGRQRSFIRTVGVWEGIWSRHLEPNRRMWMIYIHTCFRKFCRFQSIHSQFLYMYIFTVCHEDNMFRPLLF